jgi:predicted HAD superfamily hydrolase
MKQRGADVRLKDIYDNLQASLHLTHEERDKIQELELDTEMKGLIPRRDMVHLYRRLLEEGKRIILVSDMYLTKEELEPALARCGITGYERFYVSCEEKLRKDGGALWEKVLSDYEGCHIAHVGDNLHSDWQILSDRQEKTSWIMNPRQEEKIAGISQIEKAASELPKEEKLLLHGLMVNGGLYNSPFRLYPTGNPEFRDAYSIGFTIFGPLMYEYMKWLHENTPADARLAFLAREGFIFEQVYEIIYGDKAKEHFYFLASRRSVSVAAIRSREDIWEICRRDYDGDVKNLLRSRLGAPESLTDSFPEKYVHFKENAPDDEYEKTMALLEPYVEEILSYAAKEREEYE